MSAASIRSAILIGLALPMLSVGAAVAQVATPAAAEDREAPSWKFEPVLLDSQDSNGTTLAFKYDVSGILWSRRLSDRDPGVPDFSGAFGRLEINYSGKGTVAADADRNPENFLDARLSFSGVYNTTNQDVSAGAFVKIEADQSFDNEQVVVGGHVTWSTGDLMARDDFLSLDFGFGRVEPGDDTQRKTALAVAELDSYDRAEFEAVYQIPTGWSVVRVVELNYRHYSEIDAPAAIKAANLDIHEIGTIRLGLPQNLFVAYSAGRLPFDRENDETVQIGLSYELF